MFPGGPGNTFGDAGAFAQIMESLRERVFVLNDATWVYPGHGDDTTLGAERGSLDEAAGPRLVSSAGPPRATRTDAPSIVVQVWCDDDTGTIAASWAEPLIRSSTTG